MTIPGNVTRRALVASAVATGLATPRHDLIAARGDRRQQQRKRRKKDAGGGPGTGLGPGTLVFAAANFGELKAVLVNGTPSFTVEWEVSYAFPDESLLDAFGGQQTVRAGASLDEIRHMFLSNISDSRKDRLEDLGKFVNEGQISVTLL